MKTLNRIFTATITVLILAAIIANYETERRSIIRTNNVITALHIQEISALQADNAYIQLERDRIFLDHRMTEDSLANMAQQLVDTRRELANSQRHFDDLQRRYHEMRNEEWIVWALRDIDAPTITHVTADPDIVDLIIRHFNAKYSGDLAGFLDTINGGHTWEYPGAAFSVECPNDWNAFWEHENWLWGDWMVMRFRQVAEHEYYRMTVRFVPDWERWHWEWDWEFTWGGTLWVTLVVQETPESLPFLRSYPVALTASGGLNRNEWRVFDYH